VDFGVNKTINEIDVFTLQDNWGASIEPTPATAFSLYGLSGYEVQYWNGSSWVTVPGGSVTSNNKIWRKFEFSSLITSKIRVLTNAAPDGVSRITEIEAYGPAETSVSGKGVQWLVADHLGTPRMIFDQSGDLAKMKRHDYLPFGEELSAPTGGRSAGEGYSGADGMRQQFTAQERGLETNLDYFNARYYLSTQGRFTSPDPFGGSGFVSVPQSWNKYTYVLNRPFVFTDPTGEIWLTTDERTYIWVEDAEYEKNKELYKGYSITNGAIIQYRGSANCERCKGIALGKYVRLDEGGGIEEVDDPTTVVYAGYDEFDTMPAIAGTMREPMKGRPNDRHQFTTPDGKVYRERFFDPNGLPYLDIDYGHPHNPDTHVHWWDWENLDNPRGPAEPLPKNWAPLVWDTGQVTFNPNEKIKNPRPGSIPIMPMDMPTRVPVSPGVPMRPMVPLRPILVP